MSEYRSPWVKTPESSVSSASSSFEIGTVTSTPWFKTQFESRSGTENPKSAQSAIKCQWTSA